MQPSGKVWVVYVMVNANSGFSVEVFGLRGIADFNDQGQRQGSTNRGFTDSLRKESFIRKPQLCDASLDVRFRTDGFGPNVVCF